MTVKGAVRLSKTASADSVRKSLRGIDRALATSTLLAVWLDIKAAGDRLDALGLNHLRELVSKEELDENNFHSALNSRLMIL